MADLDDFFAKKDRKKAKSKKFATTEEVARKFEDTSKKVDTKPRKERPVGGDADDPNNVEQRNDDEWKDFEEEERKDYSGLKIGQLQINEEESNTGTDGEGQEIGSDGEIYSDNAEKRQTGPWKKVAEAETVPEVIAAPIEKQSASKIYISPALRNAQVLKATRLRKGVLPDIHNEEYFPVLGSAKPEEVKKKKNDPGFEEVRHGGRLQRSSDLPTHAPVSIGNRFNSLADS